MLFPPPGLPVILPAVVPRERCPVAILYPVSLDTIKAGLFFPALVRRLYLLTIWKAKQAYIFRPDRLGDLFQVTRL